MSRRRQYGAALVTAIFLIVAIAGVAAMVATLASTQQLTSGRSLAAAQAYYAARARLDRAIAAVVAVPGPGANCPPTGVTQSIAGFTTDLEVCNAVTVTEGSASYRVFTLRAAAYRGDRTAGTLVRRELRAVATNR